MSFNSGDGFGGGGSGGGSGMVKYSTGGMIPDYAFRETLNRFSTAAGTQSTVWTADRIGYVQMYATRVDSTECYPGFYVNSDMIFNSEVSSSQPVEGCLVAVGIGDNVHVVTVGGNCTYECYFIPPKVMNLAPANVSPDFMNLMCVPDYDNMESINRISAINTSWTADRSGFVYVSRNKTGGDYKNNNAIWRINGKNVSGSTQFSAYDVLEVKQGDVITLYSDTSCNNVGCYFIPPKFIDIQPSPIIQQVAGSYNTNEVQTSDTWVDGKPIYKKSWTEPGIVTANGYIQWDSGINNLDQMIDQQIVLRQNSNDMCRNGGFNFDIIFFRGTRQIRIYSSSASDAIVWAATIWYTKTTD